MSDYQILDTISSPVDVKKLSAAQRVQLAAEIRRAVINKVSKAGGHLGPNLGIVELTIALHTVFDAPSDKIVWDVSHQCYPHKMLTGRARAFTNDADLGLYSGFTAPEESKFDEFKIGHTSTSVSLATGLAKARDLQGQKGNVIAIIGDGSLSGGEAFEGLDNAAELNSNIIIIVNDNEMSIAENFGGLYGNLAELRQTLGTSEHNFFKVLGFEYFYVENGNDSEVLIAQLQAVKNTNKPTVVHIHTLKGKGYALAEQNKEKFHWTFPFDVKTGEITTKFPAEKSYTQLVAEYLEKKAETNKKIAVITAGTPGAVAINGFKAKFPQQFFDVGIAEEHAVAFASALAKGGIKPFALFYGGFIQRAYDQISQDLCLNKTPAVLVIESTGISSGDATHLAVFDIPLLSHIPNLVCLAPSSADELERMLDWAMAQTEFPVAIRTPAAQPESLKYAPSKAIELNKFEMVKSGSQVAILGLGSMLVKAENVAAKLQEKGIDATIINPRFVSGLDEEMLESLKANHHTIITLEDGEVEGGFGQVVAGFYGNSNLKVYTFGARKEFTDRVAQEELYRRYELTTEQIVAKIL